MKIRSFIIFAILILTAFSASAQSKKNSRPEEGTNDEKTVKAGEPVYFYEFNKPEFIVSKIIIEHDEKGVGKITFQKQDLDESITEPLKLSAKTLEKIASLWTEINFLGSDETYQSAERDYAHLGTVSLRMKRGGRERTADLNWTENPLVKSLTDEYRRIGNQFVWMFDMNVSRENQPLESPKIMKRFDNYLRRDEIADPKQMIPYLKGISNDERVPLITRNHAERLLKQIEKQKEDDNASQEGKQ
jgi:hypothetical protein